MLVTLDMARIHLRLPTDGVGASPSGDVEKDLKQKLEAAEAIVLDYLGGTREAWQDEFTTPALVQMGILLQLAELWSARGDDPKGQGADTDGGADGHLAPQIARILWRYRDPAAIA